MYINKYCKRDIFQISLAAYYMDIGGLLHLTAAKMSTWLIGRSPEEIKEIMADIDVNDSNKKNNDHLNGVEHRKVDCIIL